MGHYASLVSAKEDLPAENARPAAELIRENRPLVDSGAEAGEAPFRVGLVLQTDEHPPTRFLWARPQ